MSVSHIRRKWIAMKRNRDNRYRKMRSRDGKLGPLQRAVNDFLAASGNLSRGTSMLCIELWPQIVGPWYASKTQVVAIEDGQLRVLCDAPTTAQQLQLDQTIIIERLNARLDGRFVKSLRACSVGFTRSRAAAQLKRTPRPTISDADLNQVELTAEEQERCRAAGKSIPDPGIRASFIAAMENDLKRRRIKHQRGWRECEQCGAMHNRIGPLCLGCALDAGQFP